jgi:ferredoxin
MYTILLLFSEQNTVWCSEMHSPRCLHQHVPGFILDPGVDLEKYRELPLHSSLCGSCSQVCPVKIDIADQIYKWRRAVAEKGLLKLSKKVSMNAIGGRTPRRNSLLPKTALICQDLGKQFEAGRAEPTNARELAGVLIPDTLGGLRVIHKRDTV